MWCLGSSRCITPKYSFRGKTSSHFSQEWMLIKHVNLLLPRRYVFHSAGILPDPSYQGRVEYFGQPGTNNCSIRISDLRQSDSGTYVFYVITDHPTEKMPDQSGIQLLVAGGGIFIYRTLNLSVWSFLFFFPFFFWILFSSKNGEKKPNNWRDHMLDTDKPDILPLFWHFCLFMHQKLACISL